MTFEEIYKKTLLETFVYLINYLKKNNLKWYVAGGTLIGTIRHKGLIPWDDDIDIHMPRKDFEKLLQLRGQLADSGYEVRYLDEDKNYYMPFAKFCLKNTSLWEYKKRPCIFGIYIDILPIDCAQGDFDDVVSSIENYKLALSNYSRCVSQYSLHDIACEVFRNQWRLATSHLKNKVLYSHQAEKYRLLFRELERSLDHDTGDYFVCYAGAYGAKEIYKSEWYSDAIEMPFEDFKVLAPIGYDAILTQLYGNYMTPPPPEKCVASHDDRYYVNLKEGLTIKEAKNRIKKGIHKEF